MINRENIKEVNLKYYPDNILDFFMDYVILMKIKIKKDLVYLNI